MLRKTFCMKDRYFSKSKSINEMDEQMEIEKIIVKNPRRKKNTHELPELVRLKVQHQLFVSVRRLFLCRSLQLQLQLLSKVPR